MNATLLLLAGLLPLLAGPLLARWADRVTAARPWLDGFVSVSLVGMVLLHIWPHAYAIGGWLPLLAGLAGAGLPFVFHGLFSAREDRAFAGLLGVALLGLVLHAVLDGAALFGPLVESGNAASAEANHDHGSDRAEVLALAVVMHRLPMALAVWWLVLPAFGWRVAAIILGGIGIATIVGFATAGHFLVDLATPAGAIFEALIGGMLLHVMLSHGHTHAQHPERRRQRRLAIWGALMGGVLLVAIARIHPVAGHEDGLLHLGITEIVPLVAFAAYIAWLAWQLLLSPRGLHVPDLCGGHHHAGHDHAGHQRDAAPVAAASTEPEASAESADRGDHA